MKAWDFPHECLNYFKMQKTPMKNLNDFRHLAKILEYNNCNCFTHFCQDMRYLVYCQKYVLPRVLPEVCFT